jgi:5-methylcytosine-specific restriction endonuclease McrA
MNRIQLVGRIDIEKQLISFSKGHYAELLIPPASQQLKDLDHMQYVMVIGDLWSHPRSPEYCVVRVAVIDDFPGDKDAWSTGKITLHNPVWHPGKTFAAASKLSGATDGRDQLFVKMPILESRWAAKVGGIILPNGTVDLEVQIVGNSRIECTSIINDNTSADSGQKPASKLPSCDAMDWHEKQGQDRKTNQVKRSPLPPRLRRQVFLRDGFACKECGAHPAKDRLVWLEVDHIVPVAKGGSDKIANLQTLCNVCNSGKGVDAAVDHALTEQPGKGVGVHVSY